MGSWFTGSGSLLTEAIHSCADAGNQVLLFLGLVLAFVFVLLAGLTGDPSYDAIGSICIGVVLIVVSVFVGLRIKSLIVGRSAEPKLCAMIEDISNEDPVIEGLLNTITMQIGPKVMLAIKIKIRPGLSIEEAVVHINALERRLKNLVPSLGWCFVEPDIVD